MIMQQVPDPLRVGDSVVEGHSTMELDGKFLEVMSI